MHEERGGGGLGGGGGEGGGGGGGIEGGRKGGGEAQREGQKKLWRGRGPRGRLSGVYSPPRVTFTVRRRSGRARADKRPVFVPRRGSTRRAKVSECAQKPEERLHVHDSDVKIRFS